MYKTVTDYSMIQTFYADPEAVNKSGEVSITSVELFFKLKPDPLKNTSGKIKPGASIIICDVENDEPVLAKCYIDSEASLPFDQISSFSDASTSSTFSLRVPLKVATGRFYGIVVMLDDPAYEVWINKQGDKLVNTNKPSPGSNLVKDGKLYKKNNASVFKALSDQDLKFKINVAKYVANTQTIYYTNRNFEFLNISNRSTRFLGGELVYKNAANSTGTLNVVAGNNTITGNSTTFTQYSTGTPLVIYANSTASQVYTIINVSNDTVITVSSKPAFSNSSTNFKVTPVASVYYQDDLTNKMILVDSTANSTSTATRFQAGDVIVGNDSKATATIASIQNYDTDRIYLRGGIKVPAGGSISSKFVASANNGVSYAVDTAKFQRIEFNDDKVKNMTSFKGAILSRSDEVMNSNLFSNTDLLINKKSFLMQCDFNVAAPNTALFQAPSVDKGAVDLFVLQNKISNTYTYTEANSSLRDYNVVIDTEVNGNGIAASRHISTKVTFANNRFSEDIRVYMTAYRPANTELKVYARVHNSADPDAFDDRQWTPLVYKDNGTKFSSSIDRNDLIEYELGLPQYSETANVVPGVFKTQLSNSVIICSGANPATYLQADDVIKLYNPLIPEDYIVSVVTSVNSTASSVTLGDSISNNNVVGTGFKVDRLKYKHIVFNNYTNDNVARYYNSSLVEFDKFDSMQIKIVMLSDSTNKVPEVDQIQVIGVSA